MRKQNRLFCGHCGEYLSRVAFWKHRRLYYDVHSERWTTKDDLDHFEHEAKRSKPDPEFRDEANTNEWPSDSSGDEDLEEFISNQGMYQLITVLSCPDVVRAFTSGPFRFQDHLGLPLVVFNKRAGVLYQV